MADIAQTELEPPRHGAVPKPQIMRSDTTEFEWWHYDIADLPDAAGLPALAEAAGIPTVAGSALVASETRPRCDAIGEGALVNVRGLGEQPAPGGDPLVSIRLWAQSGRVVSASRRRLSAFETVQTAVQAGRVNDPGDLMAVFARAISTELDPQVAALGDRLDDAETRLEISNVYRLRRSITGLRSDAISYRRFVAPDRDALQVLAALDVDWLDAGDRLHIREAADRFARMTEELEAVRERAALLHEQLTDLRAEKIDQRSLVIAVVAFIFLPLTFITGLLGMNVEGIPFADRPWAFWGIVAFCVLIGAIVLTWFAARRWLPEKDER
ncbi:zinc transporter ZntB [Pacificimonas sp. ICDLI1SI03]